MSLKLLLIAISIVAISADKIYTVDYSCSDCKCVVDNNNAQFNYGDSFGLCVHYIACNTLLGNCERSRSVHVLKVDDYSVVELQAGQKQFIDNKLQYDTVKIVLQAHGSYKSDPIDFISFADKEAPFYANVYSAVLSIHNGAVYNVTWDNYCGLCEGTKDCKTLTLDSTTTTTTKSTTQICNSATKCQYGANSAQCDPKIYVSWIGSDVKNQKMTSAGMRMGRFRNFDMADVYESAENLNVTKTATS